MITEDMLYDLYVERGKKGFADARMCLCSYCKYMFKGRKKCNECDINHIAYFTLNYDLNMYKEFNPIKEKISYRLDMLEGFNSNNKWMYEHIEIYMTPGIYGIYIGDKLVYIGKSKNIMGRWISHIKNIKCDGDASDFNRDIYNQLRKQYVKNKERIIFKVMEYCLIDEENKEEPLDDMLTKAEDRLILKHKPRLNIAIPDGNGGYYNKKIEQIDDLLVD